VASLLSHKYAALLPIIEEVSGPTHPPPSPPERISRI
jgi:hypothetical protein